MKSIDLKYMIEHSCPKCSCQIFPSSAQKKHNDNCRSTAIADGAQVISNFIDKNIMESLLKKAQPVKTR